MDIEVSQINSSCLTLVIKLHMDIEVSQIWAVAWPWLSSYIWTLKCLRSEQLLGLGYHKLHMDIEVSQIWAVAWPWLSSYIWTLKCLRSEQWLGLGYQATYGHWSVSDLSSGLALVIKLLMDIEVSQTTWAVAWPWLSKASYGHWSVSHQQHSVYPTAWKKGRVLPEKGHFWCVKFTQKGTLLEQTFQMWVG